MRIWLLIDRLATLMSVEV